MSARASEQINANSAAGKAIFVIAVVVVGIIVGLRAVETVPAGHVKVGTLFGKIDPAPIDEGIHFVNPLKSWVAYDCRQKSHKEEDVPIPSRDQLSTTFDASVQWRVNRDMAHKLLADTGEANDAIEIQIVPKLRSLLREEGKTVDRAEEFFQEEVVSAMQARLTQRLRDFCEPRGITIDEVLLRDTRLPQFIVAAIESKKQREQEAEKQKAELERYRTEQQQLIAAAEAEKQAAEMEAQKKRTLADAQAYEIEKVAAALAQNPAYVQLKALETLALMSKDPSAKFYFLDSNSSMPLPLMHLGLEGTPQPTSRRGGN